MNDLILPSSGINVRMRNELLNDEWMNNDNEISISSIFDCKSAHRHQKCKETGYIHIRGMRRDLSTTTSSSETLTDREDDRAKRSERETKTRFHHLPSSCMRRGEPALWARPGHRSGHQQVITSLVINEWSISSSSSFIIWLFHASSSCALSKHHRYATLSSSRSIEIYTCLYNIIEYWKNEKKWRWMKEGKKIHNNTREREWRQERKKE